MRATVMALPPTDGTAKGVTSAKRVAVTDRHATGGCGRGRRADAVRPARVA